MKTAQLVRDFLVQARQATTAEIRSVTGLTAKQVWVVLQDMVSRGEARRKGPALYRYLDVQLGVRGNQQVRPRVLKAIHIKGTCSAREISKLSDAQRNTVFKIIRELISEDALERVCTQPTPSGGASEGVYRVKHRDNFYRKYVLPYSSRKEPK